MLFEILCDDSPKFIFCMRNGVRQFGIAEDKLFIDLSHINGEIIC